MAPILATDSPPVPKSCCRPSGRSRSPYSPRSHHRIFRFWIGVRPPLAPVGFLLTIDSHLFVGGENLRTVNSAPRSAGDGDLRVQYGGIGTAGSGQTPRSANDSGANDRPPCHRVSPDERRTRIAPRLGTPPRADGIPARVYGTRAAGVGTGRSNSGRVGFRAGRYRGLWRS